MDAVPLSLGQEMGGWAAQIEQAAARLDGCLGRLAQLAIGGTAVGTGLNTHPEFGRRVAAQLSAMTGLAFVEADDHFAAQASMDTATELSGHLKTSRISPHEDCQRPALDEQRTHWRVSGK